MFERGNLVKYKWQRAKAARINGKLYPLPHEESVCGRLKCFDGPAIILNENFNFVNKLHHWELGQRFWEIYCIKKGVKGIIIGSDLEKIERQ